MDTDHFLEFEIFFITYSCLVYYLDVFCIRGLKHVPEDKRFNTFFLRHHLIRYLFYSVIFDVLIGLI